jgi:hypothetical protein
LWILSVATGSGHTGTISSANERFIDIHGYCGVSTCYSEGAKGELAEEVSAVGGRYKIAGQLQMKDVMPLNYLSLTENLDLGTVMAAGGFAWI